MAMPNLPDEIIFDILTRVPVKSLMRFKCVCKPWCSLLSHPQFCKTHLQLTKEGKVSANPYKLLMPSEQAAYASIMDIEDSLVKVNYPFGIKDFMDDWNGELNFRIVGSCDGLVCLVFGFKTYIIWNPSTAEYKFLSPPIFAAHEDEDQFTYYQYYGFGYDSSMDDYKVVRGVHYFGGYGVDREFYQLEVLTLKSNKWKLINCPNVGCIIGCATGILLNESLHWIVSSDSRKGVLSFGMKEERFIGFAPLPEALPSPLFNKQLELNAFENSLFLYVFYFNEYPSRLEVWEKKEYTTADQSWTRLYVDEFWTRLYSILRHLLPGPHIWVHQFCIAKNRTGSQKAFTYDLEDKLAKNYLLCRPRSRSQWLGGVAYLETLVSPNSM